jgi:glycine dehydrogenase subunit 2
MSQTRQVSFEKTIPGRVGYTLPAPVFPAQQLMEVIPAGLLRKKPADLPEMSENDVVRHFVELSNLNYHIDKGLYPLGSCTMKYNPRLSEAMARLPGFTGIHPLQNQETVQGALALMHNLALMLAEISGMDQVTLQPAAGAHGELAAAMVIRAYFQKKGEVRPVILIPDSAHGTNPATAALAGFKVVTIQSGRDGLLDLADLDRHLNGEVAALMITNPNTLGLFEKQIKTIAQKIHGVGGLLYMDGANLNALLGLVRPGDIGFDIMHFNLHKTFGTPHGGGGPGAGPVGAKSFLTPFFPVPVVSKRGEDYHLDYNRPDSIGKVHSFYGNFLVLVRAYVYILLYGKSFLREISRNSIINANYLFSLIKDLFSVPYPGPYMHEFVVSGSNYKESGIKTLDIAKRLLDYGFYAPTVYFPLIVPEAIMIEPPETESKETLDNFASTIRKICGEARNDPETVKAAPVNTPVQRLNEVKAAKELVVVWP